MDLTFNVDIVRFTNICICIAWHNGNKS